MEVSFGRNLSPRQGDRNSHESSSVRTERFVEMSDHFFRANGHIDHFCFSSHGISNGDIHPLPSKAAEDVGGIEMVPIGQDFLRSKERTNETEPGGCSQQGRNEFLP